MEVVLIVGLFAAIVGGAIWIGRKQHQRAVAQLDALATRLGLELQTAKMPMWKSEHRVEGVRQGKNVRFWSFTRGSGKSRTYWVAAGVQPQRAGTLEFRFEPQGLATRLAEWFGAKEIQVGDRQFDEAWFVRTNAPDFLAAALLPQIRDKLMAARANGAKGDFKLEDGWVFYAEQGYFATAETVARLEALLPVLFDLADVAEVGATANTPTGRT